MVDRLDLPHLDKPNLDVLGSGNEDSVSVVVGLAEDGVEVLQSLHHPDSHLPPVRRLVRARVEGCPESFADLLHSGLQLFTCRTGFNTSCQESGDDMMKIKMIEDVK